MYRRYNVRISLVHLESVLCTYHLCESLCIQDWEYPRSKLVFMRDLGEGQFGKVMLMRAMVCYAFASCHISIAGVDGTGFHYCQHIVGVDGTGFHYSQHIAGVDGTGSHFSQHIAVVDGTGFHFSQHFTGVDGTGSYFSQRVEGTLPAHIISGLIHVMCEPDATYIQCIFFPQNIAGYTGSIPVAVKTLASRDPAVIQKFMDETELMKRFTHPNIVSLLG